MLTALICIFAFVIGIIVGCILHLKSYPNNGTKVIHLETGKEYRIISTSVRLKDSKKGWVDAVIYAPNYPNRYELFARDSDSFLKNFK